MIPDGGFRDPRDFLGRRVRIRIDRPLGSRHPDHDLVYEVNYGHVPGTMAEDGEALDAYILGPTRPLDAFTGRCIALIRRQEERDDKLIVVEEGTTLTDEEILQATRFQERFFTVQLLRP